MSDDTTKICTKCNKPFPATLEYFRARKDGLGSWCRICCREMNRIRYQENKDEILEYHHDHYLENKGKITERTRKYDLANKDKIRERKRKYYLDNRDEKRSKNRVYRQSNQDKERERHRKYLRDNPDKGRVFGLRYRARKQALPDTFTVEQWETCLEYHHFCCAVCGCQLRDLLGEVEPHADHWIPLVSELCTGTIATNMICLCNNCNCSKNATMPDVWLKDKYGTRKANIILKRIDAYFQFISRYNGNNTRMSHWIVGLLRLQE